MTGAIALAVGLLAAGCVQPTRQTPEAPAPTKAEIERKGDEIVVCGRLVHTGTRVVLWSDPGGYDGYEGSTPTYGDRAAGVRASGGEWTLPELQQQVDQFVLHYDVCGTSQACFHVLHDLRGLSVHFMLDADGTIYQTLDLKERAWHATKANDRSIGIEIANIGAYPAVEGSPLETWYREDQGGMRLVLPERFADGGLPAGFVARPAQPHPITGTIHGTRLVMYDLTPEQYDALEHLTAALCAVFPQIRCDYPREADGRLMTRQMRDWEFKYYRGLLGHWHVQANKVDPGPAFDWDRVIKGARSLLRERRAGFLHPD